MGSELTTTEPQGGALTLLGVPAKEMIAVASSMATDLKKIVDDKELFTMIPQREKIDGQWVTTGEKPFVHLEGWQILGNFVGITAVVDKDSITEVVRRDGETGNPTVLGYRVYAEAITADGRVVGSSWAECTKDEQRGPWRNSSSQARLGMAQTRAMARALKGPLGWVMKLAGYEPTPAEEMSTGVGSVLSGEADVNPDWGDDPDLADRLAAAARAAHAKDALAWSEAKVRARLSGASESDRQQLLAELNEWLSANGVDGEF